MRKGDRLAGGSHGHGCPRSFDELFPLGDAFAALGGAALGASAYRLRSTPWLRLSSTPTDPRSGIGSLSQAAELFRAGARNCRIRCIASRHGSPAALLDERAAVPRRGNLVECDELCYGIGLLLELFDADRSQRRDDRGCSTLGCHFLSSAAECPSELREPDDRERNSADHCTPHRWFHPRMDLHFVTLAVGEGNFSGFRSTREHSPWRDGEDRLGNYSDDALPSRLSVSRTGPNSLADLTLQISSLNVSTARCLMIMTPRSRLACKSALYVPTSVAAEKQHRARKLLSHRSSTATQGALTVLLRRSMSRRR